MAAPTGGPPRFGSHRRGRLRSEAKCHEGMAVYLADTWYLIALFDPQDSHHQRARRIDRFTSRDLFVTHDGVFSETLAYFSGDGVSVRRRIVDFVRAQQRDQA